MAVAVMAAVASMASVGETPSQPEALPLQGAAPYTDTGGRQERLSEDAIHRAIVYGAWLPAVAEGTVRFGQPDQINEASLITPTLPSANPLAPWQLAYHPGETIEPTPSPVQAATVRAAAYGGSLTEAEMIAVLTEAGWPVELHAAALAVSWCESRWSPYAVGDDGRSLGLFQMQWSGAGWRGWFIPAGEDEAMAYDPVVNARTAWWAYQRSSWGPWTCAAKLGLR